MKHKITEKDLFDFVFFPELLSSEKLSYLKSSNDFSNEISFFVELKNSVESELTIEDKKLIAEKITSYKPVEIIQLFPVNIPKKRKVNGLVFAAASEINDKPKVTSRTFYDDNKTYIIKVINYENTCKIFVFSTQYEVIKNFDIIITPQNVRYHIDDNTIPLELEHNVDPESIILEFNLIKQS